MQNSKKEIEIVGAGLSGLTAGINLAKAGYKVKIFEKNDVVGKRFHGDYQGIENWVYKQDALEHIKGLGLEINFPYFRVSQLNVIGSNEKLYKYVFNRPAFYLVRRGTENNCIDQYLYKQAINCGVEIVFNSPKDHRYCGDIIAQGYFPDKVTDAIVVGYTFATTCQSQHWAIFDNTIAPGGYAYCFINNGLATLAVCIFKKYNQGKFFLERAYNIFQKHIGFNEQNKKNFGGTSNSFLFKRATFNNRLYVGEAAGLIDCLWGFGMKYAFLSGHIVAQSIIKNENYDSALKKQLLPLFKASIANNWFHSLLGRKTCTLILKKMKKTKDPLSALGRMSHYKLTQKIGLIFARLFLAKKIKDRRKF